ncbi:putative F-box/kelch-repeat protein At1g15680 [Lolium perenne]|uniref:putative F-box/kelch-repeat protein At1g15680 n=1 Tax=Lolium perenne TaxID=4522 RepID=UPI0021F67ED0|nr:putative F-box/kelch-repeat protein At1g15680 isoform X1 [Lolium perenne]
MAPQPAAALPQDVLAEVLRRLAPLILAASRRVCRAWRDTVDARLRRRLLSRSVRGIFINFTGHDFSEFFSRPSTGPAICGGLDFLPSEGVKVTDHCNGLLLCGDREREYVVNPATRRWARLPPRPPPHMPGFSQSAYLAFDPAVSPHYEVFLIPRLPSSDKLDDKALLESEWPPALYVLHVFSSTADQWGEKTFLREGEAAGIVGDMDFDPWYGRYHAVYWRSTLYIHCQHGYLTRMSLSDHTYKVIELPAADKLRGYDAYHLGRSLRGVYCAKHIYCNRLQLWHLDESHDQTEWVFNYDIDLTTLERRFHNYRKRFGVDSTQQIGKPWILQDVNNRKIKYHNGRYRPPVEEKYDWNSDEDNFLYIEDVEGVYYSEGSHFLGFHPYKEIVYFELHRGRGVAYDWNSSKFQDLGCSEPTDNHYFQDGTTVSFPYTPCWMAEFPGNEFESLLEEEEIARKKSELEAQLEDHCNFSCADEYELRKLSGRAKRDKNSVTKLRRRRRITAR